MLSKEEWLEEIQKRDSPKHIVIYGAGRKAIGLLNLLKIVGIDPEAFWVTNIEENKKEEAGLPVKDVHEHPYPAAETLILIGVRRRWVPDVIEILKGEGYSDYLEPPEGIEYFSQGDLDRSKHAVLQITTQIGCRIACRYCPQEIFIKKYKEDLNRPLSMTISDFKHFIDQTTPDVIIDFAGFSEPFFNPDTIHMIKYAHSEGHPVELFTTLVGLDLEAFERIKDIPFREVVLHIPDQEGNSKIPITDEYISLLDLVLDTKKPDGGQFADWASCHGEIADEIKSVIAGKLRVITQLHDRAGNLANKELEKVLGKTGSIRCSSTKAVYHNHNVLLPDGTVLLCDSDWAMKHVLGNLKTESYKDMLNGAKSQEIRKLREMKNGDVICRKCCYAIKCDI